MLLHDAYGFIVDRIQTGGASSLNIPEEKIYEVGNFQAVATVRDTPDLTFGLETFDVSTELEALLVAADPTTTVPGTTVFDLADAKPLDITSPFKDGWNIYTASRGIVIPYLTLESSAYRFEITGNATQNHTLRGDSYFFTDGTPYYQEWDGDGATTDFAVDFGPALPYDYQGRTSYMLGVSVVFADGTYRRLFLDEDYTNTAAGFTLVGADRAPTGSMLRAVYASKTVSTFPQTIHADTTIKPAAVKGKSVDVYISDNAATPTLRRWTSVQSAEVNWSVTLDRDEEFGNPQAVSQDHDVPEVTGNVVIRPRDLKELYDRIQLITNTSVDTVSGPLTSVPLEMEIRVSDPDTGQRMKTLYVPDARFRVPNIEGRVQEKLNPTIEWTSDGGVLKIHDGIRNP